MLITPDRFSEYVGIPCVEGGRDRKGADCYGLIWLVYKEVFGIELPEYSEVYATPMDRQRAKELMQEHVPEHWFPVALTEVDVGDGLLMYSLGAPMHVGLVVGKKLLLHTEIGKYSVIESYTQSRIAQRIVGAYRHERFSTA